MIDPREVRSVTVNGRAELVVQDAESYQLMLERLERAETLAAIRRNNSSAEKAFPLRRQK